MSIVKKTYYKSGFGGSYPSNVDYITPNDNEKRRLVETIIITQNGTNTTGSFRVSFNFEQITGQTLPEQVGFSASYTVATSTNPIVYDVNLIVPENMRLRILCTGGTNIVVRATYVEIPHSEEF